MPSPSELQRLEEEAAIDLSSARTPPPATGDEVERVARAICRAICRAAMTPDAIECQVENGWDLWEDEARAAIAALQTKPDAKVEGERT